MSNTLSSHHSLSLRGTSAPLKRTRGAKHALRATTPSARHGYEYGPRQETYIPHRSMMPTQYDYVVLPASLPGKVKQLAVPRKADDRPYTVDMRVVRNPTPIASDEDRDLDTYELLSYHGVDEADVAEAARQLGAEHLCRRTAGDAAAPQWPAEGLLFRCASGAELPVVAVSLARQLPGGGGTVTATVVAFLDTSSPATFLTAEAFEAFGLSGVVTGPQKGFSCPGAAVPFRPRAAHGHAAAVSVLGADFLRCAQVQISYETGAVSVSLRS